MYQYRKLSLPVLLTYCQTPYICFVCQYNINYYLVCQYRKKIVLGHTGQISDCTGTVSGSSNALLFGTESQAQANALLFGSESQAQATLCFLAPSLRLTGKQRSAFRLRVSGSSKALLFRVGSCHGSSLSSFCCAYIS